MTVAALAVPAWKEMRPRAEKRGVFRLRTQRGPLLPPRARCRSWWPPRLSRISLSKSCVGGCKMRGRSFVAVLVVSAWALVCATLSALPALAQDAITTEQPAVPPAPSASPATPTHPADQQPQPAADSTVASIRLKLAEFGLRKGVADDDLAALEAFYGQLAGPPIFVTVTGFTAKAQGAIFEIEKADDWGLSAAAFDLPRPAACRRRPRRRPPPRSSSRSPS